MLKENYKRILSNIHNKFSCIPNGVVLDFKFGKLELFEEWA